MSLNGSSDDGSPRNGQTRAILNLAKAAKQNKCKDPEVFDRIAHRARVLAAFAPENVWVERSLSLPGVTKKIIRAAGHSSITISQRYVHQGKAIAQSAIGRMEELQKKEPEREHKSKVKKGEVEEV